MPTRAAYMPDPVEGHLLALLSELIANKTTAAKATGISRPHLSKLLNGQKPARFSELQRLCSYVGKNLTDLLIEAEDAAEADARHAG